MIVRFSGYLSKAMLAHVLAGGQAIEVWDKSFTLAPTAPRCFRGKDFAKLYDQDEVRLVATARRLGVRVIKVDRPGEDTQHIDLVGSPMDRALREAVPHQLERANASLFPDFDPLDAR